MATVALKTPVLVKAKGSCDPTVCVALSIASDVLALTFAWFVTVEVRMVFGATYVPSHYFRLWPALLIFIGALALRRLYPATRNMAVQEFKSIVVTTSLFYTTLVLFIFLERQAETYSRLVFVCAWPLSIATVISFRIIIQSMLTNKDWWGTPAIVLGSYQNVVEVVRLLKQDRGTGIKLIGALTNDVTEPAIEGIPILGSLSVAADIARQTGVSTAIFTPSDGDGVSLPTLIRRYGKYFPNLVIIPQSICASTLWVETRDVGGHLTLEVRQNLLMAGPRLCKRAFDLIIAAALGIVTLPLIIIIAGLVKLTSSGPIFYGHPRIGRSQKPFRAWKFRTMVQDADNTLARHLQRDPELRKEWERDQKLRNDPRVTWLGRLLRPASLDELPQLWNILRGDMSIVGPRPIVTSEVERYAEWFDEYSRVLPGITGLWQVSGRNETTYQRRVQLDAYYTHNWSLWFDLYLILRTIGVVLGRRGAY